MPDLTSMPRDSDIAIIGISGRFPGARNISELWDLIANRVEAIRFFSREQLEAAGIDASVLSLPNYVRAGGIPVDDIAEFDAGFFGISPREAEIMDPQHRMFLELAWEAFENAGYDPARSPGPVGVFAGCGTDFYGQALQEVRHLFGSGELELGNQLDYLATRVSFKLDLTGPSINVANACSTSLVAVYLACQSLIDYECDLALAGGVSLAPPMVRGYRYSEGGISSPDGHTRPFDAKGKGTVLANGGGIVVLRRLPEALKARDHIFAVIKGIAINNDGSARSGFTAPGVRGQSQVITAALAAANVQAESIRLIEAHGTATDIGDPIEVEALSKAFRLTTSKKGFCAIGSVKGNIGHLDSGAGVTGLIKAALALYYKKLPPTINFDKPNAKIDFGNSPFFVNTDLGDWPSDTTPRRAGVSSFGFGGTNAHAVLEEAPSPAVAPDGRGYQLVAFSARTPQALRTRAVDLAQYLDNNGDLSDVAFTLASGHAAFAYRGAVVASNPEDAARKLREIAMREEMPTAAARVPVVFMFPGQGSQYPGMARDLYDWNVVFRNAIDDCAERCRSLADLDLRSLLVVQDTGSGSGAKINDTLHGHPALFAFEFALAKMLIALGFRPDALIGHSLGEYAAACVAGIFDLDIALRLVVDRARLISTTKVGAMVAVSLTKAQLLPMLGQADLAAVNAPGMCVASGTKEEIGRLTREFEQRDIAYNHLYIDRAAHSRLMDEVQQAWVVRLSSVPFSPSRIRVISNVSGKWASDGELATPQYWARHLRDPVLFGDGIATTRELGAGIFMEVGPGRTLSTLARIAGADASKFLVTTRHPKEIANNVEVVLRSIGDAWISGARVELGNLWDGQLRRRLPLPAYPFQRERYWISRSAANTNNVARSAGRRTDIADWFYAPSWRETVRAQTNHARAVKDGRWLILTDQSGIGEQLACRLRELGHRVTLVFRGQKFEPQSESRFAVRSDSAEDFARILSAHPTGERLRIVHMWALDLHDEHCADGDVRDICYNSLLAIVQATCRDVSRDSSDLTFVGDRAFRVVGDETVCPDLGLAVGVLKVIPQEHSTVCCYYRDMNLKEQDTARHLLSELLNPSHEPVAAIRSGRRWTLDYEAIRIERSQADALPFKQNGVYVITGAFGGIGSELAEHLAENFAAKLILIGRGIDRDDSPKTQQATRLAERIRGLGGDAICVAADATDRTELAAAVDRGVGVFGSIDGAFHLAGLPGGGLLELKTAAAAAEVLAPKVEGARVLMDVLDRYCPKFVALFSSLNSIDGGIGFGDYAAANSFLDAFAHRLEGGNIPTVQAINWDRWRHVGMALNVERVAGDDQIRAADAAGMATHEALEALTRALGSGLPQVLVSTRDIHEVLSYSAARTKEKTIQEHAALVAQEQRHTRPSLTTSYSAPRDDVELQICAMWEGIFGLDKVGINDNFYELGGHSLLTIGLTSQLRARFSVDLAMREVLERTTIADLARYVSEQCASSSHSSVGAELVGKESVHHGTPIRRNFSRGGKR